MWILNNKIVAIELVLENCEVREMTISEIEKELGNKVKIIK